MKPQGQTGIEQQQQQKYEIELKHELSIPFPDEFIPKGFRDWASRALDYQSLPSLRIDIDTYRKIRLFLAKESDITYQEISFLINAVCSATPHQLEGATKDFLLIQEEAIALSFKWNSLVNPIKERVQRKVKAHIIRGIDHIVRN